MNTRCIAPEAGVHRHVFTRATALWLALVLPLAGCGASGSGGGDDDDGNDDGDGCEIGSCSGGSELEIKGFTVTGSDDGSCQELAITFAATNGAEERRFIDCGEGSLVSDAFHRAVIPTGCDSFDAVCPSYEDDGNLCTLYPEESTVSHFEANSCSEDIPLVPGTIFSLTLRVFLDDGTPVTATSEAQL